jgi:hypothetical protein
MVFGVPRGAGYEGGFSAKYADAGGGVSGVVKPLREKVMD